MALHKQPLISGTPHAFLSLSFALLFILFFLFLILRISFFATSASSKACFAAKILASLAINLVRIIMRRFLPPLFFPTVKLTGEVPGWFFASERRMVVTRHGNSKPGWKEIGSCSCQARGMENILPISRSPVS